MSSPEKLRVLTVSSLFPSSARPSFGVFVETRLRQLVKDMEVEAQVVAPVPWFPLKNPLFGDYAALARTPGYEVRHGLKVWYPRYAVIPKVGMRWTPKTLERAFLRGAIQAREDGFEFDVIDAHYLYPDGVAAANLGKRLSKPVVMTARGSDVTEIARQYPQYRSVIMEAVCSCAHVITVSESLRSELIEYGAPPDQITTLRNGIDTERFVPTGKRATQAVPKVLLFVGWLIPRKRPDLVLKAASKLPDLQVRLVGSGPEEGRLRKLALELGMERRVQFLGQQPPEEMPAHFTAADVLMLPSEREGWANVLLEAMACGTPVVSSAVDGALDLVTVPEAGRLVNSNTPEAYADAIKELLASPPDRARVRAYARHFSWQDISQAQYKIFQRAIGNVRETE